MNHVEKAMEACERDGIREQLIRELASGDEDTAAHDWALICQALLDEVEALEKRLKGAEMRTTAEIPYSA